MCLQKWQKWQVEYELGCQGKHTTMLNGSKSLCHGFDIICCIEVEYWAKALGLFHLGKQEMEYGAEAELGLVGIIRHTNKRSPPCLI